MDVLQNAVDSVGQDGWVRITTRRGGSHLEVIVEDNGCGLAAEDLTGVLDPCFKVNNGQVVTGNWSLFGSRQVMTRHGGDIRVESLLGVPGPRPLKNGQLHLGNVLQCSLRKVHHPQIFAATPVRGERESPPVRAETGELIPGPTLRQGGRFSTNDWHPIEVA